jgi:chemotaxis protein methyltransferase CheR
MGFNSDVLGLSDEAGALLRDLIHERTGVFFDNGRADLLTDKLSPLVIERGFSSLLDYYYLLKYDEAAQHEWRSVMDAISVPETYFWREMDQVNALVDVILPRWEKERRHAPFRIWSAACATGEEPLTIAMALNEAGWFERVPIQIFASDGSERAITKAQQGFYRERSFRNLPDELRGRYFTPAENGGCRIDPALTRRIYWSVANLRVESEVAPLAAVNAIFCRNVFIYFSDQAVTKTLKNFADKILQPGYLFVAMSESLMRLTTRLMLEEIGNAFVYVKPGESCAVS